MAPFFKTAAYSLATLLVGIICYVYTAEVSAQQRRISAIEVSAAARSERLATLEAQYTSLLMQLTRIESKLDRVLERNGQ